jgi:hypothetical protein
VHQVTLAHARLADQDDIGVPADEVPRRELLVLGAVDRLVEFPVEGLQRFVFRELGGGDASFDAPIASSGRLLAEQAVDRVEHAELLPLDGT